ncbi:unnamed protein product [Scytosiphon promiscuus]
MSPCPTPASTNGLLPQPAAATASPQQSAPPPSAAEGDEQCAVGSDRWRREVEGPFRRLDPNPDTLELLRLAVCAVTIIPVRVVLCSTFLVAYYVLAISFMTLSPNTRWAHEANVFFCRMASRLLLLLLGYWRVNVKGMEENAGRRADPRVFVANHISYIEVLYFLYQLGPSFVMKRTCLRVPLIGSIAANIIDSVSVDNKGGKAGGSGSEAIAARLRHMFGEDALAPGGATTTADRQQGAPASLPWSGDGNGGSSSTEPQPKLTKAEENWARGWKGNPLLLFPEGTTSNGSCLLRFKTGVFAAGVPVHPVTVKFEVGRFSPAFESIYAPVHILRTLAEPVSHLSVEYLPRFDPSPEQRADRTLYANAVQKVFSDAMGLPAVEAGYAQKTQYHKYLRREFQLHPWGRLALLLPAPDRHRAMLESWEAGRAGLPERTGSVEGEPDIRTRESKTHVGGEPALRRRMGQTVVTRGDGE